MKGRWKESRREWSGMEWSGGRGEGREDVRENTRPSGIAYMLAAFTGTYSYRPR